MEVEYGCIDNIGVKLFQSSWVHTEKAYLCFNGHIFPGEPELPSFIEAKDDGSGGDNWSYKSCKAPVKSSPSANQHPTF